MRILIFILLIFTVFVDSAKGDGTTLDIKLTNPVPVQYCTGEKRVAESLTIVGNPNIVGMKISFSGGYIASEDELVYTGSLQKSWSSASGTLLLTGISTTTVQEYVDAVKTITYKNNKAIPTLGVRKITISLSDIDYLDFTKHFYRFVSNVGITWKNARDAAAATIYYGLKGYLATITSKEENDFIRTKTTGVGWIGASDDPIEGEWRWVTGPEGLNGGLLFWKGTGYQAKLNNPPGVYGPVNGAYHNWNRWDVPYSSSTASSTWEPNQSGEEDYAHITYFTSDPNNSYKWNDLPNAGGSSGDYVPAGYLIEFGGMLGDPDVHLSATLDLQVNTMIFANTGNLPAICEGASVTLNQEDKNLIKGNYSWTPAASLSEPTIANPIATPEFPSTTYTVTGFRGTCPSVTETYTIPVNPKPVSLLNPEGYNPCKGSTIPLVAGNDPTYSYKWSNNANNSTTNSIIVSTAGDYSVTITTDKNCTAPPFTTKVIVHDLPTIDLSNVQKLICGDTKTTVNYFPLNATEYSISPVNLSDNRVTISNKLDVSVSDYGVYPMIYKAAIYSGCAQEEPFNLSFYKNPDGILDVNGQLPDQPCFGYNLNATFTPTGDLSRANYEWNFGGEIIANGIGLSTQVVPLGISLLKRDLKLTVTQDGCPTTFIKPDILVRPDLNLTVDPFGKVCAPLDVVFTAASAGAIKFEWETDNKVFSGLTFIQPYTYKDAGLWDVNLKVTTADNCKNEVKIPKMVFVAPVPVVAFSLSPIECLEPGENQISFTGTGLNGVVADKYIWYLDDFAASEQLNNPQNTLGPFKFDLITKPSAKLGLQVISEFGCESAPGSIILNRKPDFTISSDVMAGCIPFEPKLSGVKNINDLVDNIDFTWTFSNGTTKTGQQVTPTFNDPDKKYSVTVEGKNANCMNVVIQSDFLTTFPKPKADFSMDNKIVYNDKPDVKFTDKSTGATSWLWDFNDGTTSSQPSPDHHFVKTGHLKVLLEVTNTDGCTDTSSQKLLVAFDRLFPPTGFSPNAPKEVDRIFKLNSEGLTPEGYQFTVLSRWNDLVFEAKDEIKGWDGRLKNGSLAPAGSYVWILSFTDFLGRKHRQTGTVTLVY